MKLAYCIEGFYNRGGMERILSVCANMLCDTYDITIIIANQKQKPLVFKLHDTIQIVELGVPDTDRKKNYKKLLSAYLVDHHQDIVISLAGLDMYFLPQIQDGSRKIMWFHFAFDVSKMIWSEHYSGIKFWIIYYLQTWKRIYYARKFDKIVVLSKSDEIIWKKYCRQTTSINNPITIDSCLISSCEIKRAIAVGRLTWEKGFDYLIDAWKLVNQKYKDWVLDIYGEGDEREVLQHRIDSLGLRDVIHLCGNSSHIEKEYASHSVFIMSSRSEGFPLALIEASACGLPLVSFACNQGVSEIIQNGYNGFLVSQVGDIRGLSDFICELIEDEKLRKRIAAHSLESSNRYRLDKIKAKWIKLFHQICPD